MSTPALVDRSTNQSVEKAVGVLAAFSDGQLLRVADVAKETSLGQSTASRLLSTLESVGLVERDTVSTLYRLGPELISLAGVALNQNAIHKAARQTAQNLAASTGLGANVAIRREDSLFYICNFEGKDAPKSFTLIGQRNPLHATGLGKCLLLGIAEDRRAALLGEMRKYTGHTITEITALNDVLATAQTRGYATEREELALGRACVAAPILDQSGAVQAAISISGPLSAIDLDSRESELSRIVIETADRISSSLGYLGPAS